MAEALMLRAVYRARLRNRRVAVAKPRRARLADRVATLVELRQRRLDPRYHYLLLSDVVRRLIAGGYASRLHLCIRW